jgi:hypothetical protein
MFSRTMYVTSCKAVQIHNDIMVRLTIIIMKFDVHKKLASDCDQSVCWPGGEPIDCAAIDEGGEFTQSLPEGISDRRKGKDYVEVLFDSAEEECVELLYCHVCRRLAVDALCVHASTITDLGTLVRRENVGNLSTI